MGRRSTLTNTENLEKDLRDRESRVVDYLRASQHLDHFRPQHILDLVLAYINRPAKRLRPAVLLFSCGAAGGDEDIAIPAAAGIEVVHTWTLTHDDLIDHDGKRRGEPTVHVLASDKARQEFGYDADASREYGERIAILVGDTQHAWSVALFLDTPSPPVKESVVAKIIYLLESQAVPDLIRGETLDIQYEKVDVADLSEEDIVNMLWLKTGILYRFSAMAGAMLGLNSLGSQPSCRSSARQLCQQLWHGLSASGWHSWDRGRRKKTREACWLRHSRRKTHNDSPAQLGESSSSRTR